MKHLKSYLCLNLCYPTIHFRSAKVITETIVCLRSEQQDGHKIKRT